MKIFVDKQIFEKSPGFKLGCILFTGLKNTENHPAVLEELSNLTKEVNEIFHNKKPAEDPIISSVRRLYKDWKMDPSRYRPSCERLIRRILKGETLSSISSVVDTCNLCSVRYRLPIGLYDLFLLKGDVVLKYGLPGISYTGITGTVISTDKKVVLFDSEGPVGSPTTDSARTKISLNTAGFLLTVYTPGNCCIEYLNSLKKEYRTILSKTTDFEIQGDYVIQKPDF